MGYHRSDFPGGAVIAVDGKLDDGFLVQVEGAIATGNTRLLINLEKSQAIRGDHIEWMVEAHHRSERAGGMMALTDVPKDFRYILSIMELDQFFRLFETSLLGTEAFSIGAEVSSAGAGDSPAGGGGEVEDLQVLELAATKPKSQVRKSQKQLAAERDARVELFVRYVAPGMAYLYVLDALAKGKMKKFSIKQLSKASRQKAGQVSTVVGHLCELRICEVHGKGKFQYSPGQAAAEDVDDFLRMWNNPNNHSKVYKWVYQEEQELKKKTKSFTSKIKRRLFGK